ncbi:splicing factor Cactin-like [Zophobas morio]|uniref:splicing factor Cactin-like n=1 Tax=Zophobas morio TaxID=2755281 RepID=UPI003083DF49
MFEAEKEKTRQAREREELNMLGWESKEELFHIEQAKIRSRIRFEAGRAKPIDILVKYIETNQKEDDVDVCEPYKIFNDLNLIDTEDLLADIKLYLTFAENIEYWTDLKLLCEHRLEEVKRDALLRDPTKSAQHCRAFDSGLNESVRESVKTILDGKGTGELKALKNSIEKKLAYESDHVDVAYWTELLNHLDVHMAKARLTEFHATILRSKKKFLEAETMEQLPDPIIKEEKNNEIDQPRETIKPMEPETHVVDELEVPLEVEGIYSPPLCPSEDDEVITLEQFVKNLKIQRKAVWEAFCRNSNSIDESSDAQGDAWVERQRSKELEEDEEEFRAEIQLPHQLYFWSDKYRPRKPRYFNRVHTGFEWTKYNRTHYDFDNPPPKVVQGYKFNLFYPDLIDRNKAPSYSVSVDKEEKDFCVIRFSAGPPYEDIAFKIVNREWEFSHKRG